MRVLVTGATRYTGSDVPAPGCKGPAVRAVAVLLLLLCVMTINLPDAEAQDGVAASDSGESCRELRIPVSLEPGEPRSYEAAATLCTTGEEEAGDTLQVLVSGAGFDQAYWDFPGQPERYSYARAAQRAGVATLNVDRLGSGESDYPPAEEVTVESDAYVLHQVVQEGREMGQSGFDRVVTVGFSLGSAVVITEASEYDDVDGVIVTGFMHNAVPAATEEFQSAIYPADEDPKFADENLPEDYVTTRPGGREPLFFNEERVGQQVINLDERLKATNSSAETGGEGFANVVTDPGISRRIDVPTLVVVGERDRFVCGDPACSAASREYENYSPEAQVQVSVVPDTGHALNLHHNAPDTFATMLTWTQTRFDPAPPQPSASASATTVSQSGALPETGGAIGVALAASVLMISIGLLARRSISR